MECCAIHFKTFWENLAPMSSIIDWNSNRQVSSTHKIGSTQYILDETFYTSIWIYEVEHLFKFQMLYQRYPFLKTLKKKKMVTVFLWFCTTSRDESNSKNPLFLQYLK